MSTNDKSWPETDFFIKREVFRKIVPEEIVSHYKKQTHELITKHLTGIRDRLFDDLTSLLGILSNPVIAYYDLSDEDRLNLAMIGFDITEAMEWCLNLERKGIDYSEVENLNRLIVKTNKSFAEVSRIIAPKG